MIKRTVRLALLSFLLSNVVETIPPSGSDSTYQHTIDTFPIKSKTEMDFADFVLEPNHDCDPDYAREFYGIWIRVRNTFNRLAWLMSFQN